MEYPKKLWKSHNEYPLAPEKIKVGKVEKLICTFKPKNHYVLHYRNLKQQEALKGFTTGPLVTSQTRTSPRFSRLHFRLFQVHPKFLGYSAHVTRSVTMRRNILTSA